MNMARTSPLASDEVCVLTGRQGLLFGVFSRPQDAITAGVLIIAGQPQTRVGSHRMFVRMARHLAARGIAALRIDCGGWGDSPGDALPFELASADIDAAARELRRRIGPEAPLLLLGLCDGASAVVLALDDLSPEVRPAALGLINPWVRSQATHARSLLKTYYARRLSQPGLARRLLTGKVPMKNLLGPVKAWWAARRAPGRNAATVPAGEENGSESASPVDLPTVMLQALERHSQPVWAVLSGRDLTAGELESLIERERRWRQRVAKQGAILRIAGADHTLTEPRDLANACDWLGAQIESLRGGRPSSAPSVPSNAFTVDNR